MAPSIRNRIDELKSSLGRLSPREWLALGGLGLTLLLMAAVVVGYVILSGLEDLEDRNEDMRKAIRDLQKNSATYIQERQRMAALEVRMTRGPLELNSYVEQAAKAVGVNIAESGEISPVEGDRYVQRGLEVKLRKVTLEQLAKLLKELENSPQIVQITRLGVNTRWGEHQNLDVEMVVSTFEKRKEGPREGKEGGGEGDAPRTKGGRS